MTLPKSLLPISVCFVIIFRVCRNAQLVRIPIGTNCCKVLWLLQFRSEIKWSWSNKEIAKNSLIFAMLNASQVFLTLTLSILLAKVVGLWRSWTEFEKIGFYQYSGLFNHSWIDFLLIDYYATSNLFYRRNKYKCKADVVRKCVMFRKIVSTWENL